MGKKLFLEALKRNGVTACGSATSVATMDLMDKTGCLFPEAHLDAEKMAGLAETGHTLIDFDCVMPLFSVWHESAALGCDVDWGEKHRMPDCQAPLLADISTPLDVPADFLSEPACQTPLKALELLKNRLGGDAAVLGKVFGPWTLGYHVYGVENFLIATMTEPDAVKRAMRALIEVTVSFANAQIDAGIDAICLADHCTRDLCSPDAYRDFLLESHRELADRIKCPIVLHICGDTSDRLPYIRETDIDCFHFDSKVPTADARELAGDDLALMGGTSNFNVIRSGTPEDIVRDVEEKFANHIDVIGPECAVPLDAPSENLKLLATETRRRRSSEN